MRGKRSRRRGSAASTMSTPLRGSSRDRVETTGARPAMRASIAASAAASAISCGGSGGLTMTILVGAEPTTRRVISAVNCEIAIDRPRAAQRRADAARARAVDVLRNFVAVGEDGDRPDAGGNRGDAFPRSRRKRRRSPVRRAPPARDASSTAARVGSSRTVGSGRGERARPRRAGGYGRRRPRSRGRLRPGRRRGRSSGLRCRRNRARSTGWRGRAARSPRRRDQKAWSVGQG